MNFGKMVFVLTELYSDRMLSDGALKCIIFEIGRGMTVRQYISVLLQQLTMLLNRVRQRLIECARRGTSSAYDFLANDLLPWLNRGGAGWTLAELNERDVLRRFVQSAKQEIGERSGDGGREG